MNKGIRVNIKREQKVSTTQRYNEFQERYLNHEFTYDTHSLLLNLADKGQKEPNMDGVQVYKILLEVAQILLMNELEILFLGATIEEMKWMIINPCLNSYISDFRSLKVSLESDNYSKKVQLSLLLIGYIVKLYLNEGEEIAVFESKIREFMVKDYDKMYQEWVEKMKKDFKFSPKNMNKLFKSLEIIKITKESELESVNYNTKVAELVKIFDEPDFKHQPEKPNHIHEMVEEEDSPPIQPPPSFNYFTRTHSGMSLRSLGGYRRSSETSEREFGGIELRNMNSIFRQSSGFDEQEKYI